jgi:hypothetical protein
VLGVSCQAFFSNVPGKRSLLIHKNQTKKNIYNFYYRVQEKTTLLHCKNNLVDGFDLNNRCLLENLRIPTTYHVRKETKLFNIEPGGTSNYRNHLRIKYMYLFVKVVQILFVD